MHCEAACSNRYLWTSKCPCAVRYNTREEAQSGKEQCVKSWCHPTISHVSLAAIWCFLCWSGNKDFSTALSPFYKEEKCCWEPQTQSHQCNTRHLLPEWPQESLRPIGLLPESLENRKKPESGKLQSRVAGDGDFLGCSFSFTKFF